jgi:predicted O-linked N-acetylglucosamine transferase (SPINDLY family)
VQADHADAHANRGNVLVELGRFEEALHSFDRAIRLAASHGAAHYGRGNALMSLQRLDEALASYERAMALTPDDARVLNNYGVALVRMGRYEEAVRAFDRAISARPADAEAYRNRGDAFIQLKRPADALASYDRALALRPDHAEALYGRAHALTELKRGDDAISAYHDLLRLKPHPYARGMLLHAKRVACDWSHHAELVADIVTAVRAGERAITPLAFLAVSDCEQDNAQCARTLIGDKFRPSARPLWRGERYHHDRIRLVYLSADLGAHAVATQIAGVFEHHDRARFEAFAVSYGPNDRSSMRARLERAVDRFIDMHGRSDLEIASVLRDAETDIVVDITGLTGSCRPGILAFRPAGIQVQHLGFAGTLGADYVDYVIADEIVVPEVNRHHYAEKVVYLPDSYMPTDATRMVSRPPGRPEAGLPESGFVFCAFNNSYKFSPETFDIWMRLLSAVDGSVLWLLQTNELARCNLIREAQARGVESRQLVFAPYVDSGTAHLGRLALADLFLDTLPYNAHSSACDALWAGVPVLTQRGNTFAGRVGASLLRACGLSELIAESRASYERIALSLAQDGGALAGLKNKLARHRESCALFDTRGFTRHLETAYAMMWARHHAGCSPEPFGVPRIPA